MKFSDKNVSAVMVIIALLWIIIMIFGVTGNGGIGLYFTVALTCAYAVLGTVQKGNISKKLLIYPIGVWALAQVICIIGMNYYEALFRGIRPTFTILGMHPSYAFVVIFFWLAGVATWSVGLWIYRKEWLSASVWDDFINEIKTIDAKEGIQE